MSDNVVELFPSDPQYAGIVCVKPGCESAWFRVEAVCLNQELSPTGYAGLPVCVECGTVFIRRRM